MTRMLLVACMVGSMVIGFLSLGGCNTFSGMGKDSQESINALQVGPHDAYHQDARDF